MPASWLRPLLALFPRGVVAVDAETLKLHAGDAWFAKHTPQAVVFPRKAEDVAKLLKFANRRRIPVTARGAGRGYVGGCVPRRGGMVVSFAKMNRILEINPVDGVAWCSRGWSRANFRCRRGGSGCSIRPTRRA